MASTESSVGPVAPAYKVDSDPGRYAGRPGAVPQRRSTAPNHLADPVRGVGQLPEKIGAACVEFAFGPLAEGPYRLGGALRGQLAGWHSARRGSYRIIYRVDDNRHRIDDVHIDHRRDVYR